MRLNDAEMRDIRLWFGWGAVLGYPTGPLDYLRDALKPSHRADFLAMPRPKRKAVLRFVIDEHARRAGIVGEMEQLLPNLRRKVAEGIRPSS